ncbi:MAG: cation diffusion facilitator family transporter [Actinobacteria bacterium]|nr:MAG: cation diffusion facilitator family transporter [Actinomycetota bacterium]
MAVKKEAIKLKVAQQKEDKSFDPQVIVWAAFVGNGLIMVTKFVVAIFSGSIAMLAEAVHSVADTFNQLFLIISLKLGAKPADEKHPFGYGKERFFWAFIAALIIFFVGSFFSIYEGARKIIEGGHGSEQSYFVIGLAVLGIAFIFESISIGIAVREVRHGMKKAKKSLLDFVTQTRDLTLKTVLFEDGAALFGLVFAAIGMYLSKVYETALFEGLASILIGIILAVVAFYLAKEARTLLLGAAAGKEELKHMLKVFLEEPNVEKVIDLLTMYMGPESILLTSHLQINDSLSSTEQESLIDELERKIIKVVPKVKKVFIEPEIIDHRPLEKDLK